MYTASFPEQKPLLVREEIFLKIPVDPNNKRINLKEKNVIKNGRNFVFLFMIKFYYFSVFKRLHKFINLSPPITFTLLRSALSSRTLPVPLTTVVSGSSDLNTGICVLSTINLSNP